MAKKAYDHLFKLLVIGDSGVGKTCLLVRFSDGTFMDTFINTIGVDFKIKTVQVDGKKIKLQIWDTAGHERFRTITTSYYRGSKGIILVYDITQEKTYDSISKWLGDIQEHADQGVQRCILANKCDLTDKRAVSKEKGEAFARENNISFFEVSAKESINVEEAFLALASDILRKHTAVGEAEKGSIPMKSQPDRASGSGCCY